MTAAPFRENAPGADVLLDVSDLDDEFARPAPVQQRDGRDRPLIVPAAGGEAIAYQRASTFANVLTDGHGLTTWKVRHAVRGVARNGALTAKAAAFDYGEKGLDEVIEEGLLLDGATDAANYGTAFHRFTEPDKRDVDPEEIPESIRADVASFWAALDAADLKIVATEQFVAHDEYRVAGTFDHVIELPLGLGYVVADKKSGKFKPREHAVQLAVYAGGERVAVDGTRTPLDVRQDLALLIHTPHGEGRTDLRWIRLDRGREAIARALWLREWRSEKGVDLAFDEGLAVLVGDLGERADEVAKAAEVSPSAPSEPTRSVRQAPAAGVVREPPPRPRLDESPVRAENEEALLELVARARSDDSIRHLYNVNADQWTPAVRELARARKNLLDARVV